MGRKKRSNKTRRPARCGLEQRKTHKVPIVTATLEHGDAIAFLKVKKCPHCGGTHFHAAGKINISPEERRERWLGWRLSLCEGQYHDPYSIGYYVECPDVEEQPGAPEA